MNKKLIILTVCLLGLSGLSLSGCGDSAAKEREANLRTQCDTLTAEDTEGRVYEAIVGKIMANKTGLSIAQGGRGSSRFSYKIVFSNGTNKIIVSSKTMTDRTLYNKYNSILDNFIYSNRSDKKFGKYIFGICAYKNTDGKYMDKIETLTLIKGQ